MTAYYNLLSEQRHVQRLVDQFNEDEMRWRSKLLEMLERLGNRIRRSRSERPPRQTNEGNDQNDSIGSEEEEDRFQRQRTESLIRNPVSRSSGFGMVES